GAPRLDSELQLELTGVDDAGAHGVDVDQLRHPVPGPPVPESEPGGAGQDGERGGGDDQDHGWSPISRAIRRVRARSAAAPAAMPAARTRAATATVLTAPPLGGTGRARRRSPGRSAGQRPRRAAPWR